MTIPAAEIRCYYLLKCADDQHPIDNMDLYPCILILSYFYYKTPCNHNMIILIKYFHSNTRLLVKFMYHIPWIHIGVKLAHVMSQLNSALNLVCIPDQ